MADGCSDGLVCSAKLLPCGRWATDGTLVARSLPARPFPVAPGAPMCEGHVIGFAHRLGASFASAVAANFSYASAMPISVTLAIGSVVSCLATCV